MKKELIISSMMVFASISFAVDCNSVGYDSNDQLCADGTLYHFCGKKRAYNAIDQFCYEKTNEVFDKCNGNIYDPKKEFCYDGFNLRNLCNGQKFAHGDFCFEGRVYPQCAGEDYNPHTHFCYEGKLTQIQSSNIVDIRDGRIYATMRIGSQRWMAENLNFEVENGENWCYEDIEKNCDYHGRLYDWTTAVQGACPKGWHVPSKDEWNALISFVDEANGSPEGNAGKSLFSKNVKGTDEYGFGANPCYSRLCNGKWGKKPEVVFWTAFEKNEKEALAVELFPDGNSRMSGFYKTAGRPVRCVEDAK